MTITTTTVITRSCDDVWAFLTDLQNAPKWEFRMIAFERPRLLRFRSFLRRSLDEGLDLTSPGSSSAVANQAREILDWIRHL
jgi:hypothetical protein